MSGLLTLLSGGPSGPADVPGYVWQLDASTTAGALDVNGSPVADGVNAKTWLDTVSTNNAVQATTANQPIWRAGVQNGLGMLQSTVSCVMSVANNAVVKPAALTFVAVVKWAAMQSLFTSVLAQDGGSWDRGYGCAFVDAGAAGFEFWVNNYSTGGRAAMAAQPAPGSHAVIGSYDPAGGFVNLSVDGILQARTSYSTVITYDANPITLFGDGGDPSLNGYLGQLRLYNRQLSDTNTTVGQAVQGEVATLWTYLRSKWGL